MALPAASPPASRGPAARKARRHRHCAGRDSLTSRGRGEVMGIEVVTARMRSAAERLAGRGGQQGRRPAARARAGRLRSFDPARIADLEYRAWTGYYRRNWPQVLAALAGLVRAGFGMDWYRTLHGAWLLLRASQLWAPVPGNDPAGA